MMTTRVMSGAEITDAELVGASLTGNRDAFGRIVTRYQSLICSLAYSATGCLGQSEDLAQETFITAWQDLRHLREPGKLRAWLCGIARNRINNSLRREGREPLRTAEPLDAIHDSPAPEPLPPDHAISNEEESILWRSLERIPETYREPLVLFYREHQSIERVAEELELSEDAVKQRLSRGRKLLHGEVLAFVEGALERTNPGKAFTLGVLAALSVSVPQATAAGVAATAAKGSALAKSAGVAGLTGAIMGPAVGLLGAWLGASASIRATRSPRERKFMIRMTWLYGGYAAVFVLVMWGIIYFGRSLAANHPGTLFGLSLVFVLMYVAGLFWWISWGNRRQRQIQLEDGTYVEPRPTATMAAKSPSRGAIYGGLGGTILGGTAWMAVLAGRAQDWWSLGAIVLVAAGTFIASTLACLRRRDKYFAVGATSAAVIGVLAVILVNLRWVKWFGDDPQFKSWSAHWMSVAIVLLYGILALFLFSRQRSGAKVASKSQTPHNRFPLLLCSALACVAPGLACQKQVTARSAVNTQTLPNGIRVVSVCFPGSTNVSIFTFLPMGLTSDGPGQTQWSHLIEHLVIRSTIPPNSPEANGETLPDHMRLDFYGNLANWKEGLSHHRRWLESVPFTETSLTAEKPKVTAECDVMARNFAPHKFAVAAWNQGYRHGKQHVALKADVTQAVLSDVQKLRDEQFAVSNHVTLCVVSGLDSKQVLAEVERRLGGLRLTGLLATASTARPENLDLTWDLDARHLLLTWPIPDFRQPDYAALMVAAPCLQSRLASDPQLARQTGMILAGSDLATPEGSFFYISASLRPGTKFDEVRKAILGHMGRLVSDAGELSQSALIGRQLSDSLTELPPRELIRAQAPPGVGMAMIEGNLGLRLGMHEHRYGPHRAVLAKQLAGVTSAGVQQVARQHLAQDKSTVCTLTAGGPVRGSD